VTTRFQQLYLAEVLLWDISSGLDGIPCGILLGHEYDHQPWDLIGRILGSVCNWVGMLGFLKDEKSHSFT
jgi:hypothetical protein